MKEIVGANIFEPTNALFKEHRKSRSKITIVRCEKSAECKLYKKDQCTLVGSFNSTECPYGDLSVETGPTPRSKNYYSWVSDKKKKYEGAKRLGQAGSVLARVGEYIFLPYSFLGKNEKVPFVCAANRSRNRNIGLPIRI